MGQIRAPICSNRRPTELSPACAYRRSWLLLRCPSEIRLGRRWCRSLPGRVDSGQQRIGLVGNCGHRRRSFSGRSAKRLDRRSRCRSPSYPPDKAHIFRSRRSASPRKGRYTRRNGSGSTSSRHTSRRKASDPLGIGIARFGSSGQLGRYCRSFRSWLNHLRKKDPWVRDSFPHRRLGPARRRSYKAPLGERNSFHISIRCFCSLH